MDLKSIIRTVPNFPKEGILFYDLTSLWKDKEALSYTTKLIADKYKIFKPDIIVGMEARGFIVGSAIAYELNAGFVPVRKPNKLPSKTISETYALEYGTDTLCIHEEDIKKDQKVLIVDDLLATGGTVNATCKLVERLGAEIVGIAFLVELVGLGGRDKIGRDFYSIAQIEVDE